MKVWIRRSLVALLVVVVLLEGRAIWDRDAAVLWLRQASPVPFFALMGVLVAVGVPFTPLLLIAGATFGSRAGLSGSLLALAAGLALTYLIARSALEERLARWLRRFDYDLPNFAGEGKSALRLTLMVKLAPGIPGAIKNYGLALARVPFRTYFGVSMLISGGYAALLIVVGESLIQHDVSKLVWALALLLIAVPAACLWTRRGKGRDSASLASGAP